MQKTGTKANPIALESDGEETHAQAPKKKAKNTQGAPALPPAPKNAVVDQILRVKGKLEATRLQVNGCQAQMKLLFDKHSDRFENDDTLKLFESLAEAMNKAYDGAQDAGKFAEKAASMLTFGGAVF